jgi:CBS domain-containing protein
MNEFIYYQVRDVMTPSPITVGQDITLSDAEAIFEKHGFNGFPVVDERNQLIGIVTKFDLLNAFSAAKGTNVPQYDTIMGQSISQVVKKKLYAFFLETPLNRVLDKMIETGHNSFPVVEGEGVVGIVTREDVLRALRRAALGQLPTRLASAEREPLFEGGKARESYEDGGTRV